MTHFSGSDGQGAGIGHINDLKNDSLKGKKQA